jgi:hypothetical protein
LRKKGELPYYTRGDIVLIKLDLDVKMGDFLLPKEIAGIKVEPPMEDGFNEHYTVSIRSHVEEKEHEITNDRHMKDSINLSASAHTLVLKADTDEGEDVLLLFREGKLPAWAAEFE